MLNEILKLNSEHPGFIHGQLNLHEIEIEYLIKQYAIKEVGFNCELNKTRGLNRFEREQRGEKLWENKNLYEQKQEFLEYFKKDLEFSSKEILLEDKIDYMLDRALDPLDPMGSFYKLVLIKLGPTITKEGGIRISEELKRNFENLLSNNKQLIDLVPLRKLEHQQELELHRLCNSPRLKLSH